MTVDSSKNRKDYDPNGIVTIFPYDFRVDDADDLVVYEDGVIIVGGYTVSGIGDPLGGDVTYDVAPLEEVEVLSLIREVPLTQQTAYPTLGPFPAESHEEALDKLTFIAQQQQEELSRAMIVPVDTDPAIDYTPPVYAAGEVWLWDTIDQKILTSLLLTAGFVRKATDAELISGDESATDAFVDPNQLKKYATTSVNNIEELRSILYTPKEGQVFNVLGYHTPNDGGGGPKRVWETSSPLTPGFYVDNGNSIIVPTAGDGSSALVWGDPLVVRPEWFGAKGDGSVEDILYMQSYASYGGKSIVSRTYKMNDQITFASTSDVEGEKNATFDFTGATGTFLDTACIYAKGDDALPLPDISVDIVKDTDQIIFVSDPGLSVGGLIRIEHPVDYSYSGWRPSYQAGEFAVVHSISTTSATNDTITTDGIFYDDYPAAPCRVVLVDNPLKINLKRFKVLGIGEDEAGLGTTPINLWDGIDVSVEDIDISGGKSKTLTLTRCYNTSIIRPKGGLRSLATGSEYGVNIANCQKFRMEDPDIFATRHAFTTGGGFPIVNRDIIVDGGVLRSKDDLAIDCHGNTEYVKFINGSSTGASLGGNFGTIDNYDLLTAGGNAQLAIREMKGTDFTISNVRERTDRTATSGITGLLVNIREIGEHTTLGGILDINGCKFIRPNADSTRQGIVIENLGSTAAGMVISFTNNNIVFGGTPLRVLASSGVNFELLKNIGNTIVGGEPYDISNVDSIEGGGQITSADSSSLTTTASSVTLAGGASQTLFDLSGNNEILSGSVNGTFSRIVLTVDDKIIIDTGGNAPFGRDEDATRFSSFSLPNVKSHKNLKLEVFNYSGSSHDFGWNVFTR